MAKIVKVGSAEGDVGRVRQPTMGDVAKVAGVSMATVSRVLSGSDTGYTEETASLVRETARRLGYVVNSVAASLRSRQTRTIGLVIADVSNPFFGAIARGVESHLTENGYSVIFANTDNSAGREKELVRLLVDKQIDGLIVAPSTMAGSHLLNAQARGIGVVLVDSEIAGLGLDAVVIDNRSAARSAVQHCIERGHRRIAILSGPGQAAFDIQRLEGYREALMAANIEIRQDYMLRGDLLAAGGEKAAIELARLFEPPTALFVTNNMMALGVLVGLKKAGLRVFDDISLVAFDDSDWYAVTDRPITAIKNPAFDLGRAAGKRILQHLKSAGLELAPERIVLEARLIERGSVKQLF